MLRRRKAEYDLEQANELKRQATAELRMLDAMAPAHTFTCARCGNVAGALSSFLCEGICFDPNLRLDECGDGISTIIGQHSIRCDGSTLVCDLCALQTHEPQCKSCRDRSPIALLAALRAMYHQFEHELEKSAGLTHLTGFILSDTKFSTDCEALYGVDVVRASSDARIINKLQALHNRMDSGIHDCRVALDEAMSTVSGFLRNSWARRVLQHFPPPPAPRPTDIPALEGPATTDL